MKSIILSLLFAFSLPLQGSNLCEEVRDNAYQEEIYLSPPGKIYTVTGTNKLHVYTAPDKSCRSKKTHINSGEKIIAYTEHNGFFSIMYIGGDGATIEGWVEIDKLTETPESVSPAR